MALHDVPAFEAAAEADSPNLRRPPLPDPVELPTKRACLSSLDGFVLDRPVHQDSSVDEDDDDDNDDDANSVTKDATTD